MAGVVIFASALSGCATASSIGGSGDAHGFLTSPSAVASAVGAEGAQEIASYSVILGLFDSGYPEYASAVQEAVASGKQVSTVTKWLVFLTKTTAYAKAGGSSGASTGNSAFGASE